MKKFLILGVASILAFSAIPQAHAIFGVGDVVFDPDNFAQNLLSAERALVQIENQVKSLTNEAQMLINEAKNLEHLDFNSLNRLRATLANAQRLFDQAQGIAFNVAQMQEQFDRLYPAVYTAATSSDQMSADALERWQRSRDALDTALQLQSQAKENFAEDEAVLADLVTQSQSADGALQAAQATNQLLALQSRQQIQAQQIQITEGRAAALEHANVVAEQARAQELNRRFFTQETRYTAEPIRGF